MIGIASRITIDTPLAELTLRRYEKPYHLNDRELVRKFCLSLGLLQPGDSRDIIVEVLMVMLEENSEGKTISCEEIVERVINKRKEANLALVGVAASNIRRQLKRLRNIFLIEKIKNRYRITEQGNTKDIFKNKIKDFLIPSLLSRIDEYTEVLDQKWKKR